MLLYLHIPFCHRICPYCSFYKHTPGSTPIGAFVEALAIEAEKCITVPIHEDIDATYFHAADDYLTEKGFRSL